MSRTFCRAEGKHHGHKQLCLVHACFKAGLELDTLCRVQQLQAVFVLFVDVELLFIFEDTLRKTVKYDYNLVLWPLAVKRLELELEQRRKVMHVAMDVRACGADEERRDRTYCVSALMSLDS